MNQTIQQTDPEAGCMQVWGGDHASSSRYSRPGIDISVSSQPNELSVSDHAPMQSSPSNGGDLHLLSSCASGRITRLLLADVCACGKVYADFADDLRQLMKCNVNRVSQSRIVRQMTATLNDNADAGAFASTSMMTYFSPSRTLTVCNAGNPPPLLYRISTGEWSAIKPQSSDSVSGSALPDEAKLGVVDPGEFQHYQTKLANGDVVLSVSNSLTECKDATGVTIGTHGILSRVRLLMTSDPLELGSQLIQHLKSEHSQNLNEVDATAVVYKATNQSVGWRNNLLAPFRLLRPVHDTSRIKSQ